MSERMLLEASSKQEKPTVPYSLNDKSTEFLDNTAIDKSSDQQEIQENGIEQAWWRKALKIVVWILKLVSLG
jgi:hypothetical protein